MPKEWYVSFHGGDEKVSLNNIHVYSTDGKELRKALSKKSLDAGVKLRELRGFVFGPDGDLYVVNAYFEYSEVLKFKGAPNKDGQHDFAEVFVKRHADMNPGINHPFNIVFDPNGDLYVSSQNTSLVGRYHGPAGKQGRPGLPMPFPESLDFDRYLPPGTFVPSAKLASNGVLEVRAAIFATNGDLYVADRAADCVRVYEARTGHFLRNLVSEANSSINRSICCSVQTAAIFLLEAAVTIQFFDTIFAKTPQASLWHQNPVVLMAPPEWHSETMVSFTLPVVTQRRSSVTMPMTVDHPVSHSSRIWQTIRSF
jgi:hypothetical protein